MIQRFRKRTQEFLHSRFLRIAGTIFAIVVLVLALLWTILRGYSVSWSGFGGYTTPNGEYVRGKTLWDWMELLVVPLFLTIGAFILNYTERERERKRAEARVKSEKMRVEENRVLEERRTEERAKLEREIEMDRQRETALQSYFDHMADLLLKEKLKNPESEEARDVARMRTLSVLRSLDGNRKGFLLRFLQEAGLVDRKEEFIVSLFEADLRNADLKNAYLSGARLGGVNMRNANLKDSVLRGAQLEQADLTDANLTYADLSIANSRSIKLTNANLSNATLNDADFGGANLIRANLHLASLYNTSLNSADLTGANLKDADLSGADLSYAKVSEKQLASAKSLKGATMPDGTKHK